jgi:succinylglutamate desuccinylase
MVDAQSGKMRDPLVTVQSFLTQFDALIDEARAHYRVETLAPRVHVLSPKQSPLPPKETVTKDVALTVTALIHGVEVAGLGVMVEFLELVTRGAVRLEQSLGLALGNIPAALKGVRFVERDLNRSFGRTNIETAEDRRADELEALLSRSRRLLDFHQVKLTIDRPFWIFPYSKSGFEFARLVAPDVTLITHWGKGFSADGKCSDEWLNSVGGVGVTMELGQNGFDSKQISQGVAVIRRAIEVASALDNDESVPPAVGPKAPIFTWGEIIPYPQTGSPVLDPGWHNFKHVKAGERLGEFSGKVITASVSGPVLFPKYPDRLGDGTYGQNPPAAELVRILKEITEAELPK